MAEAPRGTPTSRLAARILLISGVIALIGIAVGLAWRDPKIPSVLLYANLGAALLDLPLSVGIMRARRGGWAFGVSLAITMTIVNLLGLPDLIAAGTAGVLSIALAIARATAGTLLIDQSKEFK